MDELFEHKLDRLTQDIDDLRILVKGIMGELRSIEAQLNHLPQPIQMDNGAPRPGTIGSQNKSVGQLVQGHFRNT